MAIFWASGLAKTLSPERGAAGAAAYGFYGAAATGASFVSTGEATAAGSCVGADEVAASSWKSANLATSSSSSTRIAKGYPKGRSLVPSGNKIAAI